MDVDASFRTHVLREGLVTEKQVERARALQESVQDEISPWLHHCLVAQDALTEDQVRAILDAIQWQDDTLEEKVRYLRVFTGNLETLTDIHRVLKEGEREPEPKDEGAAAEAEAPVERMVVSFVMGEEIAADNLSRTFHAADRLTGRPVALRVLREAFRERPDTINLFLHGAKVVSAFSHPNVLPVLSVGVMRSGLPFIARPYVKGASLLDLAPELGGRRNEGGKARFVAMFTQLGNAVRAAHASGVLHRRINPVNVLVGPTGEVYLDGWDFGKIVGEPDLARRSLLRTLERSRMDDAVLTGEKKRAVLASMSPELVEGRIQDVKEASDVYALGAVLFFLLTGAEPVGGVSSCDLCGNVLQGNLVVKTGAVEESRLPAAFAGICRKAMAFEPEDRYGSVEEMLDALYA